jgi:hypothetical protein
MPRTPLDPFPFLWSVAYASPECFAQPRMRATIDKR